MRQAFTLVEVLVAVAIISVVGLALLSMKQNHTYLFAKSYDKKEATSILNIVALNSKSSTTDQKADLYAQVNAIKEIKDDDLISYFKEREYEYKQSEASIIDFAEIEAESDEDTTEEQEENPYILEITKEEVYTDKAGAYLYRIRLSK